MRLTARVFVPAANPAEADGHGKALMAALAAFSPCTIHAPESYWKEPGWYEHYFELVPADQGSFDAIIALAERDWKVTRDGECDAVWNPSPGHLFLLPAVTWAEIMLCYPNPPEPEQACLPR